MQVVRDVTVTCIMFILCINAGCERCNCDLTGSVNASCDISTGNCYCRPGVGGRRCDECMQFYYGYSSTGCKGIILLLLSLNSALYPCWDSTLDTPDTEVSINARRLDWT